MALVITLTNLVTLEAERGICQAGACQTWLCTCAGDKLRVCGAELTATQQCEALESCKTSYLTLHGNGTHR